MTLLAHPLFVALASIVGTYLVTRYTSRRTVVRWRVSHFQIATSVNNPFMGKVELYYNGEPTLDTFHACVIHLTNTSSRRDIEDFALLFECSSGHSFVGGGLVDNIKSSVPWSARFMDHVSRLGHLTDAEFDWLKAHREFVIPLMPPKRSLSFTLLLSGPGNEPKVSIHIEKVGVSTAPEAAVNRLLGYPFWWFVVAAISFTLGSFATISWIAARWNPSESRMLSVAYLCALLTPVVAHAAAKAFSWLLRRSDSVFGRNEPTS